MARDVLLLARSDTVNNQSAQKDKHGLLETTAQAIGSTLGSLAVKTGIAKPQAASMEHAESQAASRPQHQPHGKHARRAKKKK
jgi:hypothetical protein